MFETVLTCFFAIALGLTIGWLWRVLRLPFVGWTWNYKDGWRWHARWRY